MVTEGQGFSILVSGFSSATSNGFPAFVFFVFSDFDENSLYLLMQEVHLIFRFQPVFHEFHFAVPEFRVSVFQSFHFFGTVDPSFFQLRVVLLQVIPAVLFMFKGYHFFKDLKTLLNIFFRKLMKILSLHGHARNRFHTGAFLSVLV